MERLKIFLVWLISLGLGLTGCKQLQPVVTQTTTNERIVKVTETLRDTTVIVKPDSASVRAFFECDSLNQVVMRELEIVKGRKVTPIVKYIDGVLKITMPVDSEAVYISWKERHELVTDSIKVSKVTTVKEKPPWYAKSLTGFGMAILGIAILIIAIRTIIRKFL